MKKIHLLQCRDRDGYTIPIGAYADYDTALEDMEGFIKEQEQAGNSAYDLDSARIVAVAYKESS